MPEQPTPPETSPRRVAVTLMSGVTGEGRPLNTMERQLDRLPPAGRAEAHRLATEALRWAARSDRLLGPHLRLKPEEPVMNALRLALYEVFEARVPARAAVHAAVDLAPQSKRGLVNGVLRNILRREPDWAALPLPGIPKWLRKRLVAAWGKEAVAAMEAVQARVPPVDLTVKDDPAGWADRLGGALLPTGSVRLASAKQISALPGFADGAWWVQDAGAALAAKMLAPEPGSHVLDLCAAPGSKTMQLAAMGADVTALDMSEHRMKRVAQNLARTGLSAKPVTADALDWTPDAPFDAILLDAPCTATGTLRRHPDLGYAKDGGGLDDLVALQAALLDRALGWLKPGGRLVYCTCSLLPEEGEAQLAAALVRHPDLTVEDRLPEGADPAWRAPRGGLRTRPDHWADRGGIDGFFIASMRKSPAP